MAEAVLSFLLPQISTFLRDESALLGGFRDEVQHIKDELDQMKDFLRIAETREELEAAWVSQVRDVAYDAEDVLDEFILRFGDTFGDGFLGRVRKIYTSIKNLKARHQIATNLYTIKNRIKNISDAHLRYHNPYDIGMQNSSSTVVQNTWYDCRGDALLLEATDLVGVERPKKNLCDMLFINDCQLRVIPIVGMGGLGKTTLVKKVYDDAIVQKRFKHHAWITISQSFNIVTLLKQAIRQLFKELNKSTPPEFDTMNVDDTKRLLHYTIHQENYILVVDDIWSTTDWEAIQMAFPKTSHSSRIIITTRNEEVAKAATSDMKGNIYNLEPLTIEESWTLFCKKAFQATSCPHHLMEISENILKRCEGLPLALVVIGGVLATKGQTTEEWDLFNKSLSEQLALHKKLDNMTKLLSLSYYDLPGHLKVCFLYLSIFPEDAIIEKKRLIQLWIAEGFVQKMERMTIEEVAEGYLNELVNRSLVQVAETTSDGRLKACRIHDIIQQIILRKAKEQDITTIFNEQGMQFSNKVRRLIIRVSIDNSQVRNGLLMYLRSLVLLDSINSMSTDNLVKLLSHGLRLLRVLDLRRAPLEVIPDAIFSLFHLKFLSLRNTNVKIVPKSIGKLQKLETLDLKYTNVTELPVEILKLQKLRHLLVREKGTGFISLCKIGNLHSLQSLCYINVGQMSDIKIVKEIGNLNQLRKLGITDLMREDGKELCFSLEKLTNLRSLCVVSINKEEVIDLQYSPSSTPQFLRTLILMGKLEQAPKWILSLHGLTKIKLCSSRLTDDPLEILQELPNLAELVLDEAYEGLALTFNATAFPVLKRLWLMNLQVQSIDFVNQTMPFLEQLWIGHCKSLKDLPAGIIYLQNLQYLNFFDMCESFVKGLQRMHPQSYTYQSMVHIPQVIFTN